MPNPYARSALRWIPVVNVDTEPAPPFGLLAATGVDTTTGRIQVQRAAASSRMGLLVNGPGQIPAGSAGQAHCTFPAIVAYDDGGDDESAPQAGQQWGSLANDGVHNSWKLHPGQAGFTILGGAAYGRVMVTDSPSIISSLALTSTSQTQIQLYDGTKINAYPAKVAASYSGNNTNLVWTNAATAVWLVEMNGGTLATSHQYEGRFIGNDSNGVAIWVTNRTGDYLTSTQSGVTLNTSWNNTSIAVTLPANSTWKLTAQITAALHSGSPGAGDTLSFRYYDGTNQYGIDATMCDAACDSITDTETGCLLAVVAVGGSAITVNLQGIVNTSGGSTGGMSGYLVAERLQ